MQERPPKKEPSVREERSLEGLMSCHSISEENVRWLPNGFVLNNEWTIQSLVRKNSYSQEYSGKNLKSDKPVSIRLTRAKRQQHSWLAMDIGVSSKMTGKEHFATIYDFGHHGNYHYVVGEQIGPTLAELCKENPKKRFSETTVFLIGIDMIEAIRSLHQNGFLHRNIRPSNFVVGSRSRTVRKLYIRNFGTCRAYCTDDGEVYPPRTTTHFHGDHVYSSADCLRRRECGRKDDFWSVLYIMIKMAVGHLPWESVVDPIQMAEMKETIANEQLLNGCPQEMDIIRRHVSSLNYYSCPDYSGMIEVLDEGLLRRGANRQSKLDWELSND
ncbi:hypothetical protein D918_04994 [Trichuris suis]|nr:hypothetical protein D918_04994 [Trichuris suis]